MELIKVAVSILPVFGFLGALVFLDSYKLVKFRAIMVSLIAGCVTAILSYLINITLPGILSIEQGLYARYAAPLIEELFKALYIIYLLRCRKVGFMVDAVIHGFAVGAGFAFVENVAYLLTLESSSIFLWVIRGFGTAVMHGGTTALFALISKNLSHKKRIPLMLFVPGFIVAFAIHSFFNHQIGHVMVTTLLQLITLPVLVMIIFARSERILRDWLEVGLDTDVRLLEYIMGGSVAKTRIGEYFFTLKRQFPGEVMADMLCFLRLHLELAIRAKGFLMMQGAGFKIPLDRETEEKFTELKFLEKSIGATGQLALAPLLHNTTRDLWQLYFLEKK